LLRVPRPFVGQIVRKLIQIADVVKLVPDVDAAGQLSVMAGENIILGLKEQAA
jgi:hypothetical protein